MQGKSLLRIVALLVVVALAVPALAKPVSKSISLPQKVRIGGTALDAGSYQLLIDGTSVTIKKGRQVVAQVEGQWEQMAKAPDYTSVLLGDNGEVKEIRFRGEKRYLVIRGN